jgi:hypothetical protein
MSSTASPGRKRLKRMEDVTGFALDLVGQPLIMCEASTPRGRLVQALGFTFVAGLGAGVTSLTNKDRSWPS